MKKTIFTSFALFCMSVQGLWAHQLMEVSSVSEQSSTADKVSYIDRRWDDASKRVVDMEKVKNKGEYYLLSGNYGDSHLMLEDGHWYVVKGDVKASSLIVPAGGNVFLIICDGAKLTAPVYFVTEYKQTGVIHIYGQTAGTGKLIAESTSEYDAGIGGTKKFFHYGPEYNIGGGNVIVYGGDITAKGGEKAPGIGCGDYNGEVTGGMLRVFGGKITARGGDYAAGIGGAWDGVGADVTVYGGTVIAYGGVDAAGIGSGEQQGVSVSAGSLTVYGGKVEGHGGGHGAGIGGGQDGSGAKVIVYGGDVFGYGGVDAAGIGSGEETFTMPSSNNGDSYELHGGSLTVYGGHVFGDGTGWGAGIGGGEDADGAKVEIHGGIVEAWAGADAGKKNGCAIGAEDGDGHRGSLKLGDKMIVHAGQNPTDAAKHLFPFDTRVPACYFRPYARVEYNGSPNVVPSFRDVCMGKMQNMIETTGIESIDTQNPTVNKQQSCWFTLDGRRLDEKPTIPGIYIMNGRKITIK